MRTNGKVAGAVAERKTGRKPMTEEQKRAARYLRANGTMYPTNDEIEEAIAQGAHNVHEDELVLSKKSTRTATKKPRKSKARSFSEDLNLDSNQISNEGSDLISMTEPYVVRCTLELTANLLYHRYNAEIVELKAKAKKGSAEKKTDNLESMVYRDSSGNLGASSVWVQRALQVAAKQIQDPTSPRKSAHDLVKASVMVTPANGSGQISPWLPKIKKWDYDDKQRVVVNRASITRTRPAINEGRQVAFDITCLAPEYIDRKMLLELLQRAGRFQGIGDFRPTYGRFNVVEYKEIPYSS